MKYRTFKKILNPLRVSKIKLLKELYWDLAFRFCEDV